MAVPVDGSNSSAQLGSRCSIADRMWVTEDMERSLDRPSVANDCSRARRSGMLGCEINPAARQVPGRQEPRSHSVEILPIVNKPGGGLMRLSHAELAAIRLERSQEGQQADEIRRPMPFVYNSLTFRSASRFRHTVPSVHVLRCMTRAVPL